MMPGASPVCGFAGGRMPHPKPAANPHTVDEMHG